MDIFKVRKYITEKNYPSYRYQQVKDAVFSGRYSSFSQINVLPKNIRDDFEKNLDFFSIKILSIFSSREKNAFKFLFNLSDDNKIETMLFEKEKGSWAICLSTQVGCPVGCTFCASGKKGLKRNLNFEEITDQFLFLKKYLIEKKLGEIKKVVYMGIGEPLINYDNLITSIKILNDYFDIGKRNISVSSFGYIPRITQFAKDMPQVNLAISLHSAVEEKRKKLIPMASKYLLLDLQKALKAYLEITNRKIFIEYVMLKGVNDRIKDVYEIIKFIDGISRRKYFTVNLIPYNKTSSNFIPSSETRIKEFSNLLISEGITSTIRKSYGLDINGACGQLAIR